MNSMRGNVDERLDALLRAYRDACPTPEPSANFMPNLWRRIDSRQSFTFSFQRMANAFVTAAVALTIVLGVYMSIPRSNSSSYSQSYLEALAEANTLDTPEYVAPVHLELSDSNR
jgi:hypothetical protein